jgi:hypothetical protein
MKQGVLSIIILLGLAPAAMAQNLALSPGNLGVSFAPPVARQEPTRSGFTALVTLGLGVQRDDFYEETVTGLAGVNLGLGGFVTDQIAILGRFTGTRGDYGFVQQTSGVIGATAQIWLNSRVAVEGGAGLGFWSDDDEDSDVGFGLIVGALASIISRGSHNLVGGIEYAPAFTSAGTVHNIGFVVGYQFIRR